MIDMVAGVGPAQVDAIISLLEPLNQTRCLIRPRCVDLITVLNYIASEVEFE